MYKRKDGLYEARVTLDDGTKKSFYGKTEREVKKKIREANERLNRESITLKEAIEMRVEAEGSDWSPNTRRAEEGAKRKISDSLLNKYLDDIKAREISAELDRLGKMGYARQTINLVRVVIASAFKYAIAEDYTENNPCAAIRTPKAPAKKRHATTDEDAEKIIRYRHDSEFGFFAYLTLLTGLRKGEALALTWNDIDFDKRVIRVNKTLCYDDDLNVIAKAPKSAAGYRVIPMTDMLYEDLQARRDEGRQHVINLSYHSLTYQAHKYAEALDLPADWSIHCNRHAFATECVKSGVDVKTAQDILGHADISTTLNIYAEVTADMRSEAAEKLSASYNKKARKNA